MAQIQDSGSNYQFYDKKIKPNIQRSGFDLSRNRQTTLDLGILTPVFKLYAMPNSDISIEYQSLLRAINVPKIPLGSRQRSFYHVYRLTFAQMWPKWGTFMSKGRSGNSVISLPKIIFFFNKKILDDAISSWNDAHTDNTISLPMTFNNSTQEHVFVNRVLNEIGIYGSNSLTNFLKIPCPNDLYRAVLAYLKSDGSSFSELTFYESAFPFFAYLSIFRSYYFNANLNVNNKDWFPDSEDDWKLINPDVEDIEGWYATQSMAREKGLDFSNMSRFAKLEFGLIRFRNWVDDYFTSSLPWPMRGNIPELDISGQASFDLPSLPFETKFGVSSSWNKVDELTLLDYTNQVVTPSGVYHSWFGSVQASTDINPGGNNNGAVRVAPAILSDVPISFASGFTWEMIRNLSISTMIQEKMARTDGSYTEFIRTFFDQYPKNFADNRPEYIGGDVQPIIYTEVLQQSEDANTPLGTVGGKGISRSDGYIGKTHFDDFGLILGIVSVMPDVYYSQGKDRIEAYQVQEDFPLPERSELGMQAIFNQEIFYTGDEAKDFDLFGYQNRYDEWRYSPNELSGELTNPGSLNFFPFTQSRFFHETPILSNEFVSTRGNIRKDYLSVYEEVPFYAQFVNSVRVVQPLPYKAVPVGLK